MIFIKEIIAMLLLAANMFSDKIPFKEENIFKIKTTAYCTGTITATGKEPRVGICAGKKEWLGKLVFVFENNDGEIGNFIGCWECEDTGFGTDKDGDGIGTIQEGKVIDMYFPTYEECKEWMKLTNGEIYVEIWEK